MPTISTGPWALTLRKDLIAGGQQPGTGRQFALRADVLPVIDRLTLNLSLKVGVFNHRLGVVVQHAAHLFAFIE